MAFCQNCGQQVPDGANHCPACGTAVFKPQSAPQQPTQPNYQQPAPQQPAQPGYQQPVKPNYQQNGYQQNGYQQNGYQQNGYQQPVKPAITDPDILANKGISVLSYIGILLLIPLFARKHSDYCKFHVKQGVILALVSLCYNVVVSILLGIIRLIAPPQRVWLVYQDSTVYTVFSWILMGLGSLAILGLAIYGIVNAASGKKEPLFLLGKIPFINKLVDGPFEMAYEVLRKKP